MRYYEASERSTVVRPGAARPGRVTRVPATRVPSGTSHGVASGATNTLCGMALTRLVIFVGTDFEADGPRGARCPACAQAAAVDS